MQGMRFKWMTDQGVHRQVLELGMPMAVAMCLLETDVARVFTDAGTYARFCSYYPLTESSVIC
jgi:hypothetical protein